MTHSSRRSYKDKYLRLREALEPDNSLDHANLVQSTIELANRQETSRVAQGEILRKLAQDVVVASELLDDRESNLGLSFPSSYHTVDSKLPDLDVSTILMRARHVINELSERVGIASELVKEQNARLKNYTTSVGTLEPALIRAQRGYLATHVIGHKPTGDEISLAMAENGKNPRLINLEYDYDTDDSASEYEGETNAVTLFEKPKKTRNDSIHIS